MNHSHAPDYERGEPWFDDGNLVLLTDELHVAFKVHRGVLARHSEVFQSMFELPSPSQADTSVEMLDACQVVRMYDIPVELSGLIKALYDGVSFQNESIQDFFFLAGILRLSTKYFIAHLRAQAIRFLSETWGYTMKGHDTMVGRALRAESVDGLTYPFAHPLHVLNLARDNSVSIIVPPALYFLSLYPLDDFLRGDHPKLLVEHPSRPSSNISARDLQDYTLLYQHRLELLMSFIRRTVGERRARANDCRGDTTICSKAFARLALRLSRSWNLRTSLFHFMLQAVEQLDEDHSICMPCRRSFAQDVTARREELWKELPSKMGLPSWEELVSQDL